MPNFNFEQKLWQKGIQFVAGADEVGRGAFAGPVVAGIVIFPPNINIQVEINDSKKLSPRKRELANLWIQKHALAHTIGEGSVAEINSLGIVPATYRAFRRAIQNCELKIENLLTDAFHVPYINGLPKTSQTPIKKGDSYSISIAAASIIAKVYRDQLMTNLSQKYQEYAWHQNKGYGTRTHREALIKHGPSTHHRKQFILSSFQAQSDT